MPFPQAEMHAIGLERLNRLASGWMDGWMDDSNSLIDNLFQRQWAPSLINQELFPEHDKGFPEHDKDRKEFLGGIAQ